MPCKACQNKRQQMYIGWRALLLKHVGLTDKKTEKEASRRAEICYQCIGAKYWCPECDCFLPASVRAVDKECPLDKW